MRGFRHHNTSGGLFSLIMLAVIVVWLALLLIHWLARRLILICRSTIAPKRTRTYPPAMIAAARAVVAGNRERERRAKRRATMDRVSGW